MFGFKKLLNRIKSIENTLGLVYHEKDGKDDYSDHVGEKWSMPTKIEKLENQVAELIKAKK